MKEEGKKRGKPYICKTNFQSKVFFMGSNLSSHFQAPSDRLFIPSSSLPSFYFQKRLKAFTVKL